MNKVILIGRLTRDPELKYSSSNIPVANFTVAVNRPFENQNGVREADFINIVVWRKQAENVGKYVKKGSLVAVEGRIQTRSYDGNDGQKRYVTEVIADSVQFLESKSQSASRTQDVTPYDFGDAPVENKNTTAVSDDIFADFGESIEVSDDDIAF